jgi:hypothetical protein
MRAAEKARHDHRVDPESSDEDDVYREYKAAQAKLVHWPNVQFAIDAGLAKREGNFVVLTEGAREHGITVVFVETSDVIDMIESAFEHLDPEDPYDKAYADYFRTGAVLIRT